MKNGPASGGQKAIGAVGEVVAAGAGFGCRRGVRGGQPDVRVRVDQWCAVRADARQVQGRELVVAAEWRPGMARPRSPVAVRAVRRGPTARCACGFAATPGRCRRPASPPVTAGDPHLLVECRGVFGFEVVGSVRNRTCFAVSIGRGWSRRCGRSPIASSTAAVPKPTRAGLPDRVHRPGGRWRTPG